MAMTKGEAANGVVPPAEIQADAMKGVEATAEEQERLATGNNNGSLDCKIPATATQHQKKSSPFYSTRVFMLVFLSGWVLQGMFLTYFVSVTTTIEKLFRVESRTTGTLLAATEIGQICTALFLTYLAGRGHRPRWIACMMLVLAVGIIGCIMPHVFYGTQLLDVHLEVHDGNAAPTCGSHFNATCNDSQMISRKAHSSMTAVVIPWLFICLLIVGVGQTGIATLGIPYVDDNVGSRQSPLYMAITIGIRVIGPALGFLLGALCTQVYVDPLLNPGYNSTDPRWVGAWWLGMVFIAGFIVLLSSLMFFFPRQIRQEAAPAQPLPLVKPKKEPIFHDFFATIKRQLTNDILMWRTASSVLHLMPISGVYSFLPKYLEKQFRIPTHDANLISGLGGILVMGVGIITAGVVILKVVPTARQVAAWTAATAAIYSTGMVLLMFIKCPEESFRMLPTVNNMTLGCSESCYCDNAPFSPVCGQDTYTYLSPCQAGCMGSRQLNNSTWLYFNCSCIDNQATGAKVMEAITLYDTKYHNASVEPVERLGSSGGGYAVSGECGARCGRLYLFVVLFAALMFIHASGEVGAVLLIIRCTHRHDKAMAMGVIQFAIGVFGNVPCPIIFGSAVDAACRLRDTVCGVIGACASYDNDKLRHFYLGLSAGLMFLAFIMDVLVWSKAGRIDMNPGDNPPLDPLPPPTSQLDPPTSPLNPLSSPNSDVTPLRADTQL